MGQAPTTNPVMTIGDVRFMPAGSDVLVAGIDVALDRIEFDVDDWSVDGHRSVHPFANRVDYPIARFAGVSARSMRGRPAALVHVDEVDAYPVRPTTSPPTTRRGRRRARGRARAARAASS